MDNNDNIINNNQTPDEHARFMPGYVEKPQPEYTPETPSSNADMPQKEIEIVKLPEPKPEDNDNKEVDTAELKPDWIRKTAQVLSAVFTPVMMPTYAYAIILLTTPLAFLPTRATVITTLIVFVLTALLPMSVILLMYRKGYIADLSIDDKSKRAIPYAVSIFCYLATAFILRGLTFWVSGFFVGAAVTCIIASIITVYWKISAHAAGMGGLTAMLMLIGLAQLAIVLIIPWISMAILLSGAVGSARVFLHKHNLAQVFSGWLLGYLATTICMLFI